jgi:hypothetical protein
MNINEVIEKRAAVGAALSATKAIEKEQQKQKADLDYQLQTLLDEQGLSRTANAKFSVSINTDTVAEVKDYDALYAHILKTQDFSLLHKRISNAAFKEILTMGEEVPGLQARDIRRINFRTL